MLTSSSLGSGESGKSTIAKQLRILYLNGFDKEDRLSYKVVHVNDGFLTFIGSNPR
jgi:hypothetical protein